MTDSLRTALDVLARELGEVGARHVEDRFEYSRGGTPFAVAESGAIDLRLGPEIADAAGRTPGTARSTRGEGWLRFVPSPESTHDRDRLDAWFRVAWRRASDK